jgi:hypothetical protein
MALYNEEFATAAKQFKEILRKIVKKRKMTVIKLNLKIKGETL